MNRVRAITLLLGAASATGGAAASCSDRPTEQACYFDDSANEDVFWPPMNASDWCEYGPGDVSPLIDKYCPSGSCLHPFQLCEEVTLDHVCQKCPADEIDEKLLAAIEVENEELCPNGSREVLEFERGCMMESSPHPPSETTKSCCYKAFVAVKPCEP